MSADHSRLLKLARAASGESASELQQRLESSAVVISAEADLPEVELTARTLITTLRRGPGRLSLIRGDLDRGFLGDLEAKANAIDPEREFRVLNPRDRAPEKPIRVHIGPSPRQGAIRIVPEGYGAHVAGSAAAVIRLRRRPNPVGAVYAASLGAAEVFKYSADVLNHRRVLHRHLVFCPVSLRNDLSTAPDLGVLRALDLTLVGVGAIGTGIALLLSAIGAQGRIVLIDRQRFAKENLGTYSIGAWRDVDQAPWKVDLVQPALSRFDIVARHISVSEAIPLVDSNDLPWTPVVMTALDSSDGRREAQRFWPDRLIDAQTGDTMLGLCDYRHGLDPCMFCMFPINRDRPSGAEDVAKRLGLSVEELAEPDAVLTDAHLKDMTDEQQELLRPHVGTLLCGLAQATGLSALPSDGFMPSVPFVSLQAACLSVGRLIAITQGHVPANSNFIQYDALYGPQVATVEMMKRRPECLCEERSAVIERVRGGRRRARE